MSLGRSKVVIPRMPLVSSPHDTTGSYDTYTTLEKPVPSSVQDFGFDLVSSISSRDIPRSNPNTKRRAFPKGQHRLLVSSGSPNQIKPFPSLTTSCFKEDRVCCRSDWSLVFVETWKTCSSRVRGAGRCSRSVDVCLLIVYLYVNIDGAADAPFPSACMVRLSILNLQDAPSLPSHPERPFVTNEGILIV